MWCLRQGRAKKTVLEVVSGKEAGGWKGRCLLRSPLSRVEVREVPNSQDPPSCLSFSSPLPLAVQRIFFLLSCAGGLRPVRSGGPGGSVMLESPEGWGKGAEDLLCGPGHAGWRLTFEKRQGSNYPFSKPLTHPHCIKYTKSNTVLH